MGFLKKFFRNVFREGQGEVGDASSFRQLSSEELEAHLSVDRYGDFLLTDAVRPSYDLKVIPREGFRYDTYHDEEAGADVPVLMAAASRERLFDLFLDMLDPLGAEVDMVLETSHSSDSPGHVDLYREHIDMPVLKSVLWDFEDMLLNDGCTGLAVLNPALPQELQFDEHKLLIVYGAPLAPFEEILAEHKIERDDDLQFITQAEHVHSSNETYMQLFEQLQCRLGMEGSYSRHEEI